jgi:hypothetical protein
MELSLREFEHGVAQPGIYDSGTEIGIDLTLTALMWKVGHLIIGLFDRLLTMCKKQLHKILL